MKLWSYVGEWNDSCRTCGLKCYISAEQQWATSECWHWYLSLLNEPKEALRKDSNAMEDSKAILGLALSIVWDSIQHLGKCITMRKFSILNIPIIIVSQIAEQCQRFCFILLPIYFIHPLYLGKGKVREGKRGACYFICWPTAFDCCEAWGYFLH